MALARAALDEQAERNVMRLSRISMGSSGDESGDLSFGLSYARSPSFANTQTPVPQVGGWGGIGGGGSDERARF